MKSTIASLLIKLGLDTSDVESGANKTRAAVTGISKDGAKASQQFKKAGAVMGGAIGYGLTSAIEQGAKFEDQLRTINTVAKFSEADLAKTGDQLQQAAVDFATTGEDMTGAFYDLVSAGVPAEKAMGVLADSATLAKGGLASTGEGVDLMTSTLGAWNLEADKSSAVMQAWGQAVAAGKTTVADLSGGISQVASIAASAGIEFEEMAAGAAQLTLTGDSASQAFTKQKAAIVALLTPNKAMLDLQAKTQKNYAEIARDKGLHVAMQEMWVDSNMNQEAFAKMLGSSEALSYGLQVSGDNFDKYQDQLAGVTGAVEDNTQAQEMMAEKMKSPVEQGKKMAAEVARLSQDFGAFFGVLAPVVMTVNQLGPAFGAATSAAKLLAGGIGTLIGGFSKPFLSLGRKAGGVFARGFQSVLAVGSKLLGPLTSKVESMFESLGKAGGGKFATAFKAVAFLGLAAVLADQIMQAIDMANKNREQAAANDKAMADLIASGISGDEAQKRLDDLKRLRTETTGLQGDLMNLGDIGKGNVLGSGMEFLFGANPAQEYDKQVAALEAYIATHPPTAKVPAEGLIRMDPSSANEAAAAVVKPMKKAVRLRTKELRETIRGQAGGISDAWDSITNAFNKGPKIQSLGARLKKGRQALRHAMAQMRKAIKAGDPLAASYWADQYNNVEASMHNMNASATETMANVQQTLARGRKRFKSTDKGITKDAKGEARARSKAAKAESAKAAKAAPDALRDKVPATASAAEAQTQAVKTPMLAMVADAANWGAHLVQRFAGSIRANIGLASSASQAVAAAAAGPIKFSSPPKKGALRTIDQWGDHMVVRWVRPIHKGRKKAERAGADLAKGLHDGMNRKRGSAGRGGASGRDRDGRDVHTAERGSRRGGERVVIQVGTLIANDAGIDALQRRMDRRMRLRKRRAGSGTTARDR